MQTLATTVNIVSSCLLVTVAVFKYFQQDLSVLLLMTSVLMFSTYNGYR